MKAYSIKTENRADDIFFVVPCQMILSVDQKSNVHSVEVGLLCFCLFFTFLTVDCIDFIFAFYENGFILSIQHKSFG